MPISTGGGRKEQVRSDRHGDGDLATVPQLIADYTGTATRPSPNEIAQTIDSGKAAFAANVTAAGHDIVQANHDVSTAHKTAVDANDAGSCAAPGDSPPQPLSHLE